MYDRAMLRSRRSAAIVAITVIASFTFSASASAAVGSTVNGTVVSHSKKVGGVTVAVYGANFGSTTTLGSAVTASDGSFTISYLVPTSGLVYAATEDASGRRRMMAVIGSPAFRSPTVRKTNNALCAMTCGGGTGTSLKTTLTINELTTVASSYGLAQYFHGNLVYGPEPGLSNAGATVSNLADQETGRVSSLIASSPNGNATATLPTFITLANIVLSCTQGSSANCLRLLQAAKVPGRSQPTNTVTAIAGLARNATTNPTGLFRLAATKGSYPNGLRKAPASWLIGLVYTAGGFDAPGFISFDSFGRSWSGNNFAPPGGSGVGSAVTVLSPTGVPTAGSPIVGGGIQGIGWGTKVSRDGLVWLANFGGNTISILGLDGSIQSPPEGLANGGRLGLSKPQGIDVSPSNNDVWIANFGNDSLTRYRNGDPTKDESFGGANSGIVKPFSVVIDNDGSVWVGNGSDSAKSGSIAKLTPDGQHVAGSPFTSVGVRSPEGMALDSAGNLWVSDLLSGAVVQLKPNGRPAVGSPFRQKALTGTWGIAVDGKDRVWVGGFLNPSIIELCGNATVNCPPGKKPGDLISPANGFTSAGIQHTTGVAIDPSGNVWSANNWSTGSPLSSFVGGNGLYEIIGAAAPVATPMSGRPTPPLLP